MYCDVTKAMTTLMDPKDLPCRVSADLRAYQTEQSKLEPARFDPFDDDQLQDVVGKHLAPIISQMFLSAELENLYGSGKSLDHFLSLVADLRKAVKQKWEDEL